jgi:hypothetical protein
MIRTLRHLADACEGDDRPHCPIIDELGSGRARGKMTARPRRAVLPAH